MDTKNWYLRLLKPSWAPPEWLFGPVWSILYVIIFFSFARIFYGVYTKEVAWLIALPFLLNLIFNFSYTPIQFGLRNNLLASIDIILILTTLIWALFSTWQALPGLHWVVYANIPYLLWVIFATILQINITYLNK
ncbi:MAG: tryptophan-rich sensory protein [Candidatus Saccharibacteria bacterium]|nr:tryptophan-rich sensory protein [Candidatus Saccharibacteria bacterium]